MRPSTRLLARYLEAGQPTGLTGLWTHRSPRSTLLYLYDKTLEKLQAVPETSLYRQSVEAVTKHRLELVKQYTPPGHAEWAAKASELIKNNSNFRVASGRKDGSEARTVKIGDRVFIVGSKHEPGDIRYEEWDGEEPTENAGPQLTPEQRKEIEAKVGKEFAEEFIQKLAPVEDAETSAETELIDFPEEPQLTAEQISELEHKIGAGLIEEVIQVAEGELQLIDRMEKAKVWEDLEEKPIEGQWTYFERTAP
ncbi:hypothetical protein NLU13_4935 [Sarocladium strictum]|uniref:NADH-ubiquinone oxidoreductase 29.9 kDa subunit n=1 Tax=Sarocladium strictum TaxID=5046 RepID=A0AA39GMG3_SARSR|nr:hypothetical protein NLU13_4935 [Sarocladium strictum]